MRDRESVVPFWFWCVLLAVVAIWFGSGLVIRTYTPIAEWGLWGDMFGAANALFSGLAFAGLIYNLYLQRLDGLERSDELKEQRADTKKTIEEFSRQTEILHKQTVEMQKQTAYVMEQNRAVNRSNFDNAFFALLGMVKNAAESVSTLVYRKDEKGEKAFEELAEKCRASIQGERNSSREVPNIDGLEGLYEIIYPSIKIYIENIVAIMFLADGQEDVDNGMYIKRITAQLSHSQMVVLLCFGLTRRGVIVKEVIDKYTIFDNDGVPGYVSRFYK